MDEAHLLAAVRYVALNPEKARLAARCEGWPWSSMKARLAGQDDGLVTVAPVLERVATSLTSRPRPPISCWKGACAPRGPMDGRRTTPILSQAWSGCSAGQWRGARRGESRTRWRSISRCRLNGGSGMLLLSTYFCAIIDAFSSRELVERLSTIVHAQIHDLP